MYVYMLGHTEQQRAFEISSIPDSYIYKLNNGYINKHAPAISLPLLCMKLEYY